jgi:hypothetical protein
MRIMRLAAAIAALASLALAAPASAAGTVVMANGGAYFTQYGPSQYWYKDWGQGYCGKIWTTCPAPKMAQWTYVYRNFGAMNHGSWTNPAPVQYPEFASAFVPARNATAMVEYTVVFDRYQRDAGYVNQNAYYDQWARLNSTGRVNVLRVDLTDQTFYGSASDKVSFDEIKIEN